MWLLIFASLMFILVVSYLCIRIIELRIKDEAETYRCKDFLLTKTEKVAYDKIKNFVDENRLPFALFPKMRLTDFLWAPKENRNAYLKIQSKFVDFLVVQSPQLHPIFAIFIVNEENKSKMHSLEIIEPALNSAGIKLIKIEAKDVFTDVLTKILREELLWQYRKNS